MAELADVVRNLDEEQGAPLLLVEGMLSDLKRQAARLAEHLASELFPTTREEFLGTLAIEDAVVAKELEKRRRSEPAAAQARDEFTVDLIDAAVAEMDEAHSRLVTRFQTVVAQARSTADPADIECAGEPTKTDAVGTMWAPQASDDSKKAPPETRGHEAARRRNALGWTQGGLGGLAGVSRRTIVRVEQDDASDETFNKIFTVLAEAEAERSLARPKSK